MTVSNNVNYANKSIYRNMTEYADNTALSFSLSRNTLLCPNIK